MDKDDLREQIEHLEDRIEKLAGSIESCRKLILVARVAIAGGAILLILLVLGAMTFSPTVLVVAMTAVLGGIVLLGSNTSTSEQARAALLAAEARRAELISQIGLRLVQRDEAT
jgi:hypothetical protein